jgi:hypothetical protein
MSDGAKRDNKMAFSDENEVPAPKEIKSKYEEESKVGAAADRSYIKQKSAQKEGFSSIP